MVKDGVFYKSEVLINIAATESFGLSSAVQNIATLSVIKIGKNYYPFFLSPSFVGRSLEKDDR